MNNIVIRSLWLLTRYKSIFFISDSLNFRAALNFFYKNGLKESTRLAVIGVSLHKGLSNKSNIHVNINFDISTKKYLKINGEKVSCHIPWASFWQALINLHECDKRKNSNIKLLLYIDKLQRLDDNQIINFLNYLTTREIKITILIIMNSAIKEKLLNGYKFSILRSKLVEDNFICTQEHLENFYLKNDGENHIWSSINMLVNFKIL
ncbi:MAG: hypothetical protein ACK48F_05285 [Chryseotalea sp.]